VSIIVTHKRASYDYHILDRFEAGIILTGSEVKSIRMKRVSISESFGRLKDGEIFLFNAHIAPYPQGVPAGYDPRATRKLLLNRREIEFLINKTQEGLSIIPLKIYTKRNRIKVEIALARSKKKYDKREKMKEKAIKREIEKRMKAR